eukprot:CAMPEP_0206021886 /NCGR_PEP_ID=MMETSP1464-20131121/33716_1 /ASSEMBLY_ACC=CAM_ASM_001124 /TAXON_ID=119497 /ORGANISM="Exanthemachrysis gayraliae, Strain RCC1523" /LENGTH=228 /DNA_ID=CAMNT_0053395841 /DNA_START=356 /DNA_END=1039 /DNA_ORIENTATION=+
MPGARTSVPTAARSLRAALHQEVLAHVHKLEHELVGARLEDRPAKGRLVVVHAAGRVHLHLRGHALQLLLLLAHGAPDLNAGNSEGHRAGEHRCAKLRGREAPPVLEVAVDGNAVGARRAAEGHKGGARAVEVAHGDARAAPGRVDLHLRRARGRAEPEEEGAPAAVAAKVGLGALGEPQRDVGAEAVPEARPAPPRPLGPLRPLGRLRRLCARGRCGLRDQQEAGRV